MRHPLSAAPVVPPQRATAHRLPVALRLLDGPAAAPAHELARDAAVAVVEAALFAADEPLPPKRLAQAAGLESAAARAAVARLRDLLQREGSAFQVVELAGGHQLLTRPEHHPWVARLRRGVAEASMSQPARETLAVVAYRQPITRADVEGIRGVGCAEVLRQLMERGLVRLAGRDDTLGRPSLYETTRKFLQLFGLRSLKDLPPAEGL